MGELRACLLPVGALRTILGAGPARREQVLELVARTLPSPGRPKPLGPIFTRVPGTPLVRDDDPTPDDLDRLLAHGVVPESRARATWRLVEAVASAMAASTTRSTTDRPAGLAPLGLAVPEPEDLVVGSWTVPETYALPSLSGWLDSALAQVPAGPDAPQVVVFWEPGPAG